MPDRSTWIGYALLVATAVGWSGAWITARLAAHEAPALTVTTGRFVLASAALLPVWWATDRGTGVRLTRRDGLLVLGMSLTGITTYTALFLTGVALAPATDGAIVTPGFVGLFSVLIGAAASRTWPTRLGMLGALVALAGALLAGWGALSSAGLDSSRALGDGVFVLAAAAYGAYTVLGERLSANVPPVTAILLASTLGCRTYCAEDLAPASGGRHGLPRGRDR